MVPAQRRVGGDAGDDDRAHRRFGALARLTRQGYRKRPVVELQRKGRLAIGEHAQGLRRPFEAGAERRRHRGLGERGKAERNGAERGGKGQRDSAALPFPAAAAGHSASAATRARADRPSSTASASRRASKLLAALDRGLETLVRREARPRQRPGLVPGHALAARVAQADLVLGLGVPLFRGAQEPAERGLHARSRPGPVAVHLAQVVLGPVEALLRRLADPEERRLGVGLRAQPGVVHLAQRVLGSREPLVGRPLQPIERRREVLAHPLARDQARRKIVLGRRVSALRGPAPPLDRARRVLVDALALIEQDAEVVLGPGVALLGKRPPLVLGGGEVAALIGFPPGVEVGRRRRRRQREAGKRYDRGAHALCRCRGPCILADGPRLHLSSAMPWPVSCSRACAARRSGRRCPGSGSPRRIRERLVPAMLIPSMVMSMMRY